MTSELSIAGVRLGTEEPVYAIAELSANHGGSLERALETIRAAADAGAAAIKLQTYRPDTMTLDLDRAPFVLGRDSPWAGRKLFDLYGEAMTPWEWHAALFDEARANGIACFSSPFDARAIDLLESLDCPAYKIASFELGDLELIGRAASTGKPMIMSTGMATADEIDDAVGAARASGDGGVVLLRCNSTYPAPPEEMDLASIPDMRQRWAVEVGLSDHTMANVAAIAAVSLGAVLLEKHFILRRSDGGPDSAFSQEPDEFARLVRDLDETRRAVGSVRYGPSPSEAPSLALRRSLWIVRDVAAGELLTTDNVRAIRPAGGLPPKHLAEIVGRRAKTALPEGTPVTWASLE